MTAAESWDLDDLFDFLRASYPYRELKRRQFDLLVEMLAGRYADSRVRELDPRVSVDRIDNTIRARRGAARLVYLSGGTIPDRGYFHLRHHESMAKLGELDEEFVWERSLGDTFSLGAQSWRINRITHNDVLVSPAYKSAAMAPFWRAEARNRGSFLSDRIARFLERAESFLSAGERDELLAILGREHCMDPAAAAELVDLLVRQRAATDGPLPHRHHLLIEKLVEDESADGHQRVIFHTGWGGPSEPAAGDGPRSSLAGQVRRTTRDRRRERLPHGLTAARLRADRALGVGPGRQCPRASCGIGSKEPASSALAFGRTRAEHCCFRARATGAGCLFGSTVSGPRSCSSRYRATRDFPILFETWRTCLQDEFELESLKEVLDELAREEIRISEAATLAPSPFAANLIWHQTNRLMYEDDVPEGGESALRSDLLKELVFSSSLRPENSRPRSSTDFSANCTGPSRTTRRKRRASCSIGSGSAW